MNIETENFIKEGLKRYKQASEVYFTFRKELQNKLQAILKARKDWGLLKPNISSVKSTTFGQDYPLLNSRIDCDFNGKILTLVIAVNWYQSESDFPFFELWIEKADADFSSKQDLFNWDSEFSLENKAICYYPNPENYNLDKDFNKLLDEFIRFINKFNVES